MKPVIAELIVRSATRRLAVELVVKPQGDGCHCELSNCEAPPCDDRTELVSQLATHIGSTISHSMDLFEHAIYS